MLRPVADSGPEASFLRVPQNSRFGLARYLPESIDEYEQCLPKSVQDRDSRNRAFVWRLSDRVSKLFCQLLHGAENVAHFADTTAAHGRICERCARRPNRT